MFQGLRLPLLISATISRFVARRTAVNPHVIRPARTSRAVPSSASHALTRNTASLCDFGSRHVSAACARLSISGQRLTRVSKFRQLRCRYSDSRDIDTIDDTRARDEFLHWAFSSGIRVSQKVQVLVPTARGRGVLAVDDVKSGEVLMSGPWKSALVESSSSLPPVEALARFWNRWPSPEMRLAARFVTSRDVLGEYFAVLPSHESIRSPGLRQQAQRLGCVTLYDDAVELRRDLVTSGTLELQAAGIQCCEEDFAKALHAAYSRGFVFQQGDDSEARSLFFIRLWLLLIPACALALVATQRLMWQWGLAVVFVSGLLYLLLRSYKKEVTSLALFPIVDMINHARDAPLRFSFGERRADWTLSAGRDFASGEEVVFNYDQDSVNLLIYYGFME